MNSAKENVDIKVVMEKKRKRKLLPHIEIPFPQVETKKEKESKETQARLAAEQLARSETKSLVKKSQTLVPYKTDALYEFKLNDMRAELKALWGKKDEMPTSQTHKIVKPQLGHLYTIQIPRCEKSCIDDASKLDGLTWRENKKQFKKNIYPIDVPILKYSYDNLDPRNKSLNAVLKKHLYFDATNLILVIQYTKNYQAEEVKKGEKEKDNEHAEEVNVETTSDHENVEEGNVETAPDVSQQFVALPDKDMLDQVEIEPEKKTDAIEEIEEQIDDQPATSELSKMSFQEGDIERGLKNDPSLTIQVVSEKNKPFAKTVRTSEESVYSAVSAGSLVKESQTLVPYKTDALYEYKLNDMRAELKAFWGKKDEIPTSQTHKIVKPQLGHLYTIQIPRCEKSCIDDASKLDGLTWRENKKQFKKNIYPIDVPILKYSYDNLDPRNKSLNAVLKKHLYFDATNLILVIQYTKNYQAEEVKKGEKEKDNEHAEEVNVETTSDHENVEEGNVETAPDVSQQFVALPDKDILDQVEIEPEKKTDAIKEIEDYIDEQTATSPAINETEYSNSSVENDESKEQISLSSSIEEGSDLIESFEQTSSHSITPTDSIESFDNFLPGLSSTALGSLTKPLSRRIESFESMEAMPNMETIAKELSQNSPKESNNGNVVSKLEAKQGFEREDEISAIAREKIQENESSKMISNSDLPDSSANTQEIDSQLFEKQGREEDKNENKTVSSQAKDCDTKTQKVYYSVNENDVKSQEYMMECPGTYDIDRVRVLIKKQHLTEPNYLNIGSMSAKNDGEEDKKMETKSTPTKLDPHNTQQIDSGLFDEQGGQQKSNENAFENSDLECEKQQLLSTCVTKLPNTVIYPKEIARLENQDNESHQITRNFNRLDSSANTQEMDSHMFGPEVKKQPLLSTCVTVDYLNAIAEEETQDNKINQITSNFDVLDNSFNTQSFNTQEIDSHLKGLEVEKQPLLSNCETKPPLTVDDLNENAEEETQDNKSHQKTINFDLLYSPLNTQENDSYLYGTQGREEKTNKNKTQTSQFNFSGIMKTKSTPTKIDQEKGKSNIVPNEVVKEKENMQEDIESSLNDPFEFEDDGNIKSAMIDEKKKHFHSFSGKGNVAEDAAKNKSSKEKSVSEKPTVKKKICNAKVDSKLVVPRESIKTANINIEKNYGSSAEDMSQNLANNGTEKKKKKKMKLAVQKEINLSGASSEKKKRKNVTPSPPTKKVKQNSPYEKMSKIIKKGRTKNKPLLAAQPIADFWSTDDVDPIKIMQDPSKQPFNSLGCIFKPKENGEVYIIRNIDFNSYSPSEVTRLLNQADMKQMSNDGSSTLKTIPEVIKHAFTGSNSDGTKIGRGGYVKYMYVCKEERSCVVHYIGDQSLITNRKPKSYTFNASKLRPKSVSRKTATPKRDKNNEEDKAHDSEPTNAKETLKTTFDLYNNKTWKSSISKILKTNIRKTRPVRFQNDSNTLLEAMPAHTLVKTQEISYGHANMMIQEAVSHDALLDASKTVILSPEGGYVYLMHCKNFNSDWRKKVLIDNYKWKLTKTEDPCEFAFQVKTYKGIDKDELPSEEFTRYTFYNTKTKNLLIHYFGDETKAIKQQHSGAAM